MGRDRGRDVLVVRGQRSTSARTPPPRRFARVSTPERRFRRPEPEAGGHAAGAPRPRGAGEPSRGRRVLLVDDESAIRLICSINFNASGWECTEAADGEEALALIRVEQPDVVLLDVMMPRLDGWMVAERLLADPATSDIPVVFLTARTDPRDREHAYRFGAVGYLTKPLDPVRLPAQVDAILVRLAHGEREQLREELLAES